MRKILLAAACLLAAAPAAADVTGPAAVMSGDVIWVNGQYFRLYGVDAPELLQFCFVDGKPWECGPAAIRNLEILVALEPATCGETGDPPDELGVWAVCTVGGKDLSETMARLGWAHAIRSQSDDYVAAEMEAKTEGVGIWRSTFLEPRVFREDQRTLEDQVAARVHDGVRERLEHAMTDGNGGIEIFQNFSITRDGDRLIERRHASTAIDPVYHIALDPADVLVVWRDALVESAHSTAIAFVWQSLTQRPAIDVEVQDAAGFLAAMDLRAAPLIAAGRQPVLLVRSSTDPEWMEVWFKGEPPPGLQVTHKDDITAHRYLGTVNGIDVYHGPLDEGQAMLITADFLREITYGTDADGHLVNISTVRTTGEELDRLFVSFRQGTTWSDDQAILLHYPFEPTGDAYDEE